MCSNPDELHLRQRNGWPGVGTDTRSPKEQYLKRHICGPGSALCALSLVDTIYIHIQYTRGRQAKL